MSGFNDRKTITALERCYGKNTMEQTEKEAERKRDIEMEMNRERVTLK